MDRQGHRGDPRYGVVKRSAKMAAAMIWAFGLALLAPGAAAKDAQGRIVIAALGDSLTQGYGLAQDQGFVPQLQAWLDQADAGAVVRNAGVSGDTTAGGLARVDWTLTDDVDAMIVTLGGNDFLRGLPPELARANLDGILAKAAEQGVAVLLVGMEATNNYGPAYKAAFDSMYPDLAETYQTLLAPNFFSGLFPDEGDASAASLAPFMQADGIHPNSEGVTRIVDSLGPSVLTLVEQAR